MKKILIIIAGSLVLFTIYYYFRHPIGKKAVINGHTINLELAVTNPEKERGLGYRDSLPPDTGMLFVYQNKDKYGFWMKGMRFPLDFIWIDGNRIVDVSPNIPAPENDMIQPVSLSPQVPVDKILEVNTGTIESFRVRIGDLVQFTN